MTIKMEVSELFRTQYQIDFQSELTVDIFAGGGGASTGFEMGSNRPVDIAINHDADAISTHKANHPNAIHYQSDVFEVDPLEATQGRSVGHLHFSPDCTDHSQAAGGQPRRKAIRSLAWVGIRWAGKVRPRVITMENVEQMLDWSPLVANRDKATGRVIKLDRSIARLGERVPVEEQYLVPDTKRRGHSWQAFIKALRGLGYAVQWQTLKASDYGAATRRKRLFLVARCDGVPIEWPRKTHSETPKRGQKQAASAADIIDWSHPGKSIFNRKRPLAEATLKRIAKGIFRHVLNKAEPFIVPIANYGSGAAVHDIREPLRTITAWPKGGAFAVATPVIAQMNGGFNTTPGHDPRRPLSTITTTGSQQQLVEAILVKGSDTQHEERPSPALQCGANVHAFLMEYYSQGGQWADLRGPLPTITTKHRLALVEVVIDGISYAIIDITLRMLTPRELYRGQGFPESYIIDRRHDGTKLTKTKQVRMVGNSVSPMPMAALLRQLRMTERKWHLQTSLPDRKEEQEPVIVA